MAAATVRVRGLRELDRAFRAAGGELPGELRGEMRQIAEPVAQTARRLAAGHRFSPRSVSGIRAGIRRGGAVIRQGRRKVTGRRGDFGALQMRLVLIPAVSEHEQETVERMERMLDRLGARHGF